jgi:HlyD family secretion protein
MPTRIVRWIFWPTAVVLVIGTTYFLWYYSQPRRHLDAHAAANKDQVKPFEDDPDEGDPQQTPDTTNVKVVRPRRGAMERITVQVGSVEADEVQLQAKVSGYLKSITRTKELKESPERELDIGDSVTEGQELAVIDVPELEKQVKRNKAVVDQAKARVRQMTAKVAVARADLVSANAQIVYAEANARAAKAWLSYRELHLARMTKLKKEGVIEEKLEEESMERCEAAKESENAAKAAIVTSDAKSKSAYANILLSKADLREAKAQMKVAQAELEKSEELFKYSKIVAPFNGHITERMLVRGAFVRSAADGGAAQTLFTIQSPDRMRMVVQIPDSDAPYAVKGKIAYVEIDAFPADKKEYRISRIAKSEDPKTRLMHVEIDLPNPDGKIRQGMFGKVTIILDKMTKQLSIPSSCLAGKAQSRKGTVFVERDGKAYLKKVTLGMDNGARVEVLQGLKTTDRVILSPAGLTDGIVVQATLYDETELKADNAP